MATPVFYDTMITGIIFFGPFKKVEAPNEAGLLTQQHHSTAPGIIPQETPQLPELDLQQSASLCVFATLLSEQITTSFKGSGQISEDAPHDQRIRHFIDRNFRKEIHLKDLAKFLNVSDIRVCQLMRSHFDQTFSEAVAIRRIEHAKYLLKNSRMKISSIASESGYNDTVYFYRQFKRYSNMSPGEFRKQFQSRSISNYNLLA